MTVQQNSSADEINKLRIQIKEDEQLKQALEQSYYELLNTSKELEKRMNMIDDEIQLFDQVTELKLGDKQPKLAIYEGNEWKTRFENQEEINRQLNKQIILLEHKIEELRDKLKHRNVSQEEKLESNPDYLATLNREKESLINQLRDYEWRLEQENKAYHKANEERKDLHQEIIDTRNAINAIKERNDILQYQQATVNLAINHASNAAAATTTPMLTSRVDTRGSYSNNNSNNKSVNDDYYNIPMDKRILDPKRGPINKNATVRVLPKLDNN